MFHIYLFSKSGVTFSPGNVPDLRSHELQTETSHTRNELALSGMLSIETEPRAFVPLMVHSSRDIHYHNVKASRCSCCVVAQQHTDGSCVAREAGYLFGCNSGSASSVYNFFYKMERVSQRKMVQ